MGSNPYYDAPAEDQGREQRTSDWNKSEMISFLDERYDEPLDEFGADDYDELAEMIEQQGLPHDEETDWRYEQVRELGQRNYSSESAFGLVPVERADEIENPEPWEVKFKDEDGETQIHWKNH
jgi:hypothetical protein